MRHFSDEELAAYRFDPEQFDKREELERHLAECAACADIVTAITEFDESLGSEEAWHFAEELVTGARQAELNRIKERRAREDEKATRLLRRLVDDPFELLWADIPRKARFRTGGVVRVLCGASERWVEVNPLHALNLAEAAASVASALPDDLYPARAVEQLRGLAWKQRANACRYLGRLSAALDSIDRAERAYSKLLVNAQELASVRYVRGTILWKFQRFDEALAAARESARGFAEQRDHTRWLHAKILEGSILCDAGALHDARELFGLLKTEAEAVNNLLTAARVANNNGWVAYLSGDYGGAAIEYVFALQLFEQLNAHTEAIRVRWNLGVLAVASSNGPEAINRLKAAIAELKSEGMLTDAALATLDLAEAYLSSGDSRAAERCCREVFDVLSVAKIVPAAMTAAAFLHQAAQSGKLTRAAIRYVRQFCERAESDASLEFLPPPGTA
ncbi:MAG TPA: hypothetical protein VFN10_15015 [Thermoanaerobaculia bacterium]|nr:hypothetical protein [Thermoanaerobaculia bacterium]